MKFIPILFSTEMVQAILAGRKTQTRRFIKPQPENKDYLPRFFTDQFGKQFLEFRKDKINVEFKTWKCPYGQVGDVLWVRETMILNKNSNTYWPVADGYSRSISALTNKPFESEKVVPSIHMPKEACRLFLKIKSIRVERLNDITEGDAALEGVELMDTNLYKDYIDKNNSVISSRISFATLWHSINGEESWNSNPWVWVIEFECIEKPKNF